MFAVINIIGFHKLLEHTKFNLSPGKLFFLLKKWGHHGHGDIIGTRCNHLYVNSFYLLSS